MPTLAKSPNSDLSRGFTVPQVAEKYGWTAHMLWSLALEKKYDLEREDYPEKSISILSRKEYFGSF